jgi:hypothetical protein
VGFFSEDIDAVRDALRDARRSPKATGRSAGEAIASEGNRMSQDEQTPFKVIVSTVVPSIQGDQHAT